MRNGYMYFTLKPVLYGQLNWYGEFDDLIIDLARNLRLFNSQTLVVVEQHML